ncbi:Succinate--CoA ligase [GDP-forming] subunit alpha [bacterium HR26]|nr:Succinate--CoA ligase [GDP-forming] subunit alpha [bacterium HR26]
MAILLDRNTRVLVQGITGREARMVTAHMLAYGTAVVCGVTPGRGGEEVAGVPVYDTVAEAVVAHRPTAALISVPPAATLDATLEAIEAGLRLLLIATERVPKHDALRLLRAAGAAGVRVIGPNSVGLINPSQRVKLGAIGGDRPERAFVPGRIGVISRSGGMTAELGLMLRRRGFGVSTAVSVGGDALIGTPPADLLPLFQADPETDAVVLFGEPGTRFEEDVAEALADGRFSKPLFALVAGRFTESLPEGTAFGHAAAIIRGGSGRPSTKLAALRQAGAWATDDLDELFRFLDALASSRADRKPGQH